MTSANRPSVPSDPISSLGRSNPLTFFTVGAPQLIKFPSALT